MDTRGLPLRGTFTLSAALTATLLLGVGCNPYERRFGEYSAGAVDPVKFTHVVRMNPLTMELDPVDPTTGAPPLYAYVGIGGNPKQPGLGSFQFHKALVRGETVVYYPLPFTGVQQKTSEPVMGTKPNAAALTISSRTPIAYVFDSASQGVDHDTSKCVKRDGYMYDRQQDDVRYDRQGNILTLLPADSDPTGNSSYVPLVREVAVNSRDNPCQDIKSESNLVTRTDIEVALKPPPEGVLDGLPSGYPTDRYLLWAVIDPAADVKMPEKRMLDPVTGLGPQRWGWYKKYLVAYLDGGYVPTEIIGTRTVMKTQSLFVPTVRVVKDEMGMDVEEDVTDFGSGLDIMEYKRGEVNYSPVCEVKTFVPSDPKKPAKSVADIDRTTITSTGQYVYCIQTP